LADFVAKLFAALPNAQLSNPTTLYLEFDIARALAHPWINIA